MLFTLVTYAASILDIAGHTHEAALLDWQDQSPVLAGFWRSHSACRNTTAKFTCVYVNSITDRRRSAWQLRIVEATSRRVEQCCLHCQLGCTLRTPVACPPLQSQAGERNNTRRIMVGSALTASDNNHTQSNYSDAPRARPSEHTGAPNTVPSRSHRRASLSLPQAVGIYTRSKVAFNKNQQGSRTSQVPADDESQPDVAKLRRDLQNLRAKATAQVGMNGYTESNTPGDSCCDFPVLILCALVPIHTGSTHHWSVGEYQSTAAYY